MKIIKATFWSVLIGVFYLFISKHMDLDPYFKGYLQGALGMLVYFAVLNWYNFKELYSKKQ